MLKISFCIIIIINYSNQDSCTPPNNLGMFSVVENNTIGSPIFNYTVFQQASDILSVTVLAPNENNFSFNVSTMQLIALIVFDSKKNSSYNVRLFMTCTSSNNIFEQIVEIKNSNGWIFLTPVKYYTGYITDNSSNNTPVIFNSSIKFSTNYPEGSYSVDLIDDTFYATTSQLSVTILNKKLLNYDIQNVYNLILSLQNIDQTTGAKKDSINTTVIINVIKTYNKPPVFEMSFYTFQIFTNATNNSIFQVFPKPIKAVDRNVEVNASILYKFANPISYLFLDSSTGEMRSNAALLSPTVLQTTIIAFVLNNVNLQSLVNVSINISNVPFTFYRKFQSEIVQEGTLGTIQLNYTSEQNKKVNFTMIPELSNFRILSSGLILIQNTLNYNLQNIYNFTITGSDGTTSDQMILFINVSKAYDPMFSMPSYIFNCNSNDGNIDGIISVVNFNPKSTITFFLLNDYGLFKIRCNSSSCTTYIPQEDIKKIGSVIYQLVVNFSDSSQPPISKSVNVTVDFRICIQTTTKPPVITSNELLIICILVPIIVLLILIFPILLCYYKKRRIYRAAGEIKFSKSSSSNQPTFPRDITKSQIFNESNFQVYDVYSSDSLVRQLRPEIQPRIFPSLNKQKNIFIRSKEIDFSEIMEIVVGSNENASIANNDIDKCTNL